MSGRGQQWAKRELPCDVQHLRLPAGTAACHVLPFTCPTCLPARSLTATAAPPAGAATSYAFEDLSGQDLRKNRYTKADMRGTILR